MKNLLRGNAHAHVNALPNLQLTHVYERVGPGTLPRSPFQSNVVSLILNPLTISSLVDLVSLNRL
jgi:hypothetical protein